MVREAARAATSGRSWIERPSALASAIWRVALSLTARWWLLAHDELPVQLVGEDLPS